MNWLVPGGENVRWVRQGRFMGKTELIAIVGEAYTCTETRTGPPLSYVAEKLRHCLEGLQSCHGRASDDSGQRIDLWGPFNYALTAYLALHNVLKMAEDGKAAEKLLCLPGEEFRSWLDSVAHKGSLTILPN